MTTDEGTSPWIPYTPSRESSVARSDDMQAVIPLKPIVMLNQADPVPVYSGLPLNLARTFSHSLVQLTPATSLTPHLSTTMGAPLAQSSLVVTKSVDSGAAREVFITGPNPSPETIEIDSDTPSDSGMEHTGGSN